MALVLGRLPGLVWQHGTLCTHPERASPNEVIAAAVQLIERLLEKQAERDKLKQQLSDLNDYVEELDALVFSLERQLEVLE